MKQLLYFFLFIVFSSSITAQQTPFEKSNGLESATYFEAIDFYKKLDKVSPKISIREIGPTDAGYPLHIVLLSADGRFNPEEWHSEKKVVIMVNNGIHPGEPDGIDASMMLARDIAKGKLLIPKNVCLAIVPVYSIGGALNRDSFSRVNQNGPAEYGFRGNSQNLNLNRDFTKCETRETRSFIKAFHWLDPDILIDNHVSDGADFQHTMTLITTQPDKLGGELGRWLKSKFEPSLYKTMNDKGWEMSPYVDFENTEVDKGMTAFFDSPRYSTGYAALWQTIAFMPETHMLKPFKDRTLSTYSLMQTMMEEASKQSAELISLRQALKKEMAATKAFPLSWQVDTTQYSMITFKGYEQGYKISEATGLQRMYYDHAKPFTKTIPFRNTYQPSISALAANYYVIPQGWHNVLDILQLNKVTMRQLKSDSAISVQVYKIKGVKSAVGTFEGHHLNSKTILDTVQQTIHFLKGDYLIPLNQRANRFLVEMLEPTAGDSYFTWNFFDAILQQKEGYTDYRWEDVAADWLQNNPALKEELAAKRKADKTFANDASQQLQWIYQRSPYYEPEYKRYPVFKIQ